LCEKKKGPFEAGHVFGKARRSTAAIVGRIEMLGNRCDGKKVIAVFPKAPRARQTMKEYLRRQRNLPGRCLPLVGPLTYSVSPALVERVRQGGWDPSMTAGDRRKSRRPRGAGLLARRSRGEKRSRESDRWCEAPRISRAPCTTMVSRDVPASVHGGLIEPGAIAGGIQDHTRVYGGSRYNFRRSGRRWRGRHAGALRPYGKEPRDSVRRRCWDHWSWVISNRTRMGTARMARVLMNVCGFGGRSWTVIPIRDASAYPLSALEPRQHRDGIPPFKPDRPPRCNVAPWRQT